MNEHTRGSNSRKLGLSKQKTRRLLDSKELRILHLKNEIKRIEDFDPEKAYPENGVTFSEWMREWDFSKADTKIYTHGIHQYPAMFIPQVIRKIILEFSNENDTVLDIFSGSGTTMVECIVTGRKSIGIEQNPLGVLLSKVKTTPIDIDLLIESYLTILSEYESSKSINVYDFSNIDIWFTEETKLNLSKLIHSINDLDNHDVKDAFRICFSDIIRYVSTCKHSGFKMHRDKNKINKQWTSEELLDEFHDSVVKLLVGISQLNRFSKQYHKPIIFHGDSRKYYSEIPKESIDLIVTSPPYGDSRTTVAYGQFSRLSCQWLGLIREDERGIENIDATLLGGDINGVCLDDEVLKKSTTLQTSFNNYLWEIERCSDIRLKGKLERRAKDVISFYKDLDMTIRNGADYLATNKYFVLVTGSRVVKNVKLNTDLISAEIGENYGLVLDGILYRKTIPKKRMPARVSATNVIGETAPTMTKESIVLLRKVN